MVVVAGCGPAGSDATPTTAESTVAESTVAESTVAESTSTVLPAEGGQPFEIESLGLTFSLPATFETASDPELLFLARSRRPPAIISIDADSESVTDHVADPGEVVSDLPLPGVDAVVVTNAVLEGLPAGISANELLVSNGEHSFSVIMSGVQPQLAEQWDVFIRSIVVTPAG
jgi:hypothetical protein